MTDTAPLKSLEITRDVPFGHCDPAGILYTPRALDFCLEAIDAFWKEVLDGPGWYEMNVDLDRGTPFVNVNIDFKSPISARATLRIELDLTRLGASSLTHEIRTYQEDRLCFVASLTSVMVVKSKMSKIETGDWLRAALGKAL